MEQVNKIKAWFAGVAGALTGLWGWMGWLVIGWVACMALDYVTGSMAAAKAGQWSSQKAKEGIWHKAGMVVVVLVAAGADLLIGAVLAHLPVIQIPFEYAGLVCPIMLVWYIITELGSAGENAVKMGAPVPKWLPKLLAVGKDAVDKAGDGFTGSEPEETEREDSTRE